MPSEDEGRKRLGVSRGVAWRRVGLLRPAYPCCSGPSWRFRGEGEKGLKELSAHQTEGGVCFDGRAGRRAGGQAGGDWRLGAREGDAVAATNERVIGSSFSCRVCHIRNSGTDRGTEEGQAGGPGRERKAELVRRNRRASKHERAEVRNGGAL